MNNPENLEAQIGLPGPEKLLVSWAFDGGLPYGTYPEDVVDDLNNIYKEFMFEPVALSHYLSLEYGKISFSKEDVIQGGFRGYELIDDCRDKVSVGIRIYANLAPASSPGIHREDLYPLWNEEEQSLKVPNFNYNPGGSIWRTILQNGIKFRF